MRPPQHDIDLALKIEDNVPDELMTDYDLCMNGIHMRNRTTSRELRDGCILIHHVYLKIHPEQKL